MQIDDFDNLSKNDHEIKLLLSRVGFSENVAEFRKKWAIPPNGFADNKHLNTWAKPNVHNPEFESNITDLRRHFDLTQRWQTAIKLFLITGDVLMLRAQSASRISFTYEEIDGRRTNVDDISITTSTDITEKETLENHRYVRQLVSAKKKQPSFQTDRNLELYRMYKSGMKIPDITKKWNATHAVISEDYIRKIITRMMHKLE